MEENEINEENPNADDNTPMLYKDDEDSTATNVNWDEDRFVWDLSELEILNN